MAETGGDPTLRRTHLPFLNVPERETLGRLLLGESEQRIASKMRITRWRLVCSVKRLYGIFGVRSRGELLRACLDIMGAYGGPDPRPPIPSEQIIPGCTDRDTSAGSTPDR